MVVTNRNVVRSALALIVVFAGVAAQFIILAAEFVAVTQVLVYIGAIMVLMLFGIMLTRSRIGRETDIDQRPLVGRAWSPPCCCSGSWGTRWSTASATTRSRSSARSPR